jgi:hypothetical protein
MYATGGLMVVFEYYLWALEIASYWFKPEELKLHYLSDQSVMQRWKKQSLYWAGALSAFAYGNFMGVLDNYLVAPLIRTYLAASFAL